MKATIEDPDVFMREGRTYHGNGSAESKADAGKRPRFTLIPFDSLKPGTARRYLVKGMIPRTGMTLVWGPPKCGKSFWTFDAMMHLALGWEYRGRRVHPGHVVYVALEGGDGMNARAEAFRQQHGLPRPSTAQFHLINDALELVSDHAALVTAIKNALTDEQPVAVVIDTVNRSFQGSESSDQDMTAYIRAADAVWQAFGSAVVLVHHCGHDGNRPRGHSALLGAVDAQIAVTRDGADNIIATVERMKDGPEGATMASRLEQMEVGTDEDGEPITSCIVVPVEGHIAKPVPTRRLSDKQKVALDCLADLAIDGKPLPQEWQMPDDIRAVPIFTWRAELERRGAIDRDAANPRADFKRLKDGLQARHLIGERDGLTWKV